MNNQAKVFAENNAKFLKHVIIQTEALLETYKESLALTEDRLSRMVDKPCGILNDNSGSYCELEFGHKESHRHSTRDGSYIEFSAVS